MDFPKSKSDRGILGDGLRLQLYKALERRVESMDERMGVLGYVKWTVQVHNSPLTREILMLVEREADLMYRGRPAHSLSGLRQRILGLFVQVQNTTEIC
jgi:nucleotide-binding universal stress UspA family protein